MGQYSKTHFVRIRQDKICKGLRTEFRIIEVAHTLPRYLRSSWKRKELGGLEATLYKRIPHEKTVCMPNQAVWLGSYTYIPRQLSIEQIPLSALDSCHGNPSSHWSLTCPGRNLAPLLPTLSLLFPLPDICYICCSCVSFTFSPHDLVLSPFLPSSYFLTGKNQGRFSLQHM